MFNWINNLIPCIPNYKIPHSNGKELDIYIPTLSLGIEFNGIYWHSTAYKDKNFHVDKLDYCKKNNIKLIYVWEDTWHTKKEIVKSRILSAINKTERKIHARKCEIRVVNKHESKKFFTDNHLQGNVSCSTCIGLYFNNNLVSAMSFGQSRKIMGRKGDEIELLRFCSIKFSSVVGGAGKLFKHFIDNYTANSIISYANRDWSIGNVYTQIGFNLIRDTPPNYWYIINNDRAHRWNFRKSVLVSQGFDKNLSEENIMKNRGYYRIYDSGNYLFTWVRNK